MELKVYSFVGLPDRIIIKKINELEREVESGTKSVQDLRTELSEFYKIAVNQEIKKAILMEYDGIELTAKRNVT